MWTNAGRLVYRPPLPPTTTCVAALPRCAPLLQLLLLRLGLTSVAACTAEGFTYPVDMIKTRLQLQVHMG